MKFSFSAIPGLTQHVQIRDMLAIEHSQVEPGNAQWRAGYELVFEKYGLRTLGEDAGPNLTPPASSNTPNRKSQVQVARFMPCEPLSTDGWNTGMLIG